MNHDRQLHIGRHTNLAPTVILDTSRGPIVIADHVTIGHYSIIHSNTTIGDNTHIGAHTSIGIPEHG